MHDENERILPTVRIQKIVLDNFKSVHHGECVFSCAKKFVKEGTHSDILGVYGQNGSGKTALIEALSILRYAMSGSIIIPNYTDCISVGADTAHLEFTFDFQYQEPSTEKRTVVYAFDLGIVEADDDVKLKGLDYAFPTKRRIKIFNEVVSASGDFNGEQIKLQPIIRTDIQSTPIGPARKIAAFIGTESRKDKLLELEVNKRLAAENSQSFIFMSKTMKIFEEQLESSAYVQILNDLQLFARMFLYVVDTKSSGLIRLNAALPLFTRYGVAPIELRENTVLPVDHYRDITKFLGALNGVLNQLIPGLSVITEEKGTREDKDGIEVIEVEFLADRDGATYPIRYESDGVIKIISVLWLLISVFNDKSCTVAIDELDAGIYEFLLGEILSAIEEYGVGQLIFTSHNLRPLEVISKESIIFTTSNPDNRYIRLKGVGSTNNLRDVYLREILVHEQDEQVYNAGKRHRMISAFKKAGPGFFTSTESR